MTSDDCTGILLTLCALDGSEEFDFVEAHQKIRKRQKYEKIRGVKTRYAPTYPIDFYKIASTWTPLTPHDYTGILLILYALDDSEEFDFVETRVLV